MSSGGVLFTPPLTMPVGDPIRYVITLPSVERNGKRVELHCSGKVVRQQEDATAATLERYEFVRA
jgi:hypothetical protein